MNERITTIVDFWLDQDPARYFQKDPEFDQQIQERFREDVNKAISGSLFDTWTESPPGILALILLLDQFPRNLFRNSPKAYFGDNQAVYLSRMAINQQMVEKALLSEKQWYLMPLMHSENVLDQQRSLEQFTKYELEQSISFAQDHHDIIQRFGRFPHRNIVMARVSSPEEKEFLEHGGFSG